MSKNPKAANQKSSQQSTQKKTESCTNQNGMFFNQVILQPERYEFF